MCVCISSMIFSGLNFNCLLFNFVVGSSSIPLAPNVEAGANGTPPESPEAEDTADFDESKATD